MDKRTSNNKGEVASQIMSVAEPGGHFTEESEAFDECAIGRGSNREPILTGTEKSAASEEQSLGKAGKGVEAILDVPGTLTLITTSTTDNSTDRDSWSSQVNTLIGGPAAAESSYAADDDVPVQDWSKAPRHLQEFRKFADSRTARHVLVRGPPSGCKYGRTVPALPFNGIKKRPVPCLLSWIADFVL